MKKSSFNRGMAKLQRRGVPKRVAFKRMKLLSSINKDRRVRIYRN